MNNSATIAHRGRSRASALMVVASVLMLIAASALAKDSNPSPGDAKAADLTGLSLQALYDLEVVQPNVLGGHTHPAGQIMFGFQYMHVNSGDIYDGSEKISAADVFAQGYGAAHIQMDMDMYMIVCGFLDKCSRSWPPVPEDDSEDGHRGLLLGKLVNKSGVECGCADDAER